MNSSKSESLITPISTVYTILPAIASDKDACAIFIKESGHVHLLEGIKNYKFEELEIVFEALNDIIILYHKITNDCPELMNSFIRFSKQYFTGN